MINYSKFFFSANLLTHSENITDLSLNVVEIVICGSLARKIISRLMALAMVFAFVFSEVYRLADISLSSFEYLTRRSAVLWYLSVAAQAAVGSYLMVKDDYIFITVASVIAL